MESGEFRLILALLYLFIIGAIGIVLNVPISEVLVLSVGRVFWVADSLINGIIRREETLVLNYALIDTSNLLKRFRNLHFSVTYYQLFLSL